MKWVTARSTPGFVALSLKSSKIRSLLSHEASSYSIHILVWFDYYVRSLVWRESIGKVQFVVQDINWVACG